MKKFLTVIFVSLFTAVLFGQGNTTATMTGVVNGDNGEPLVGANVVAVHNPSGTRYGASTRIDGRFTIPGMRVGGPYTVTASYVGFNDQVEENVYLKLGVTSHFEFSMKEAAIEIAGVTVVSKPGSVGENSGTSTQISTENLEELPSLDRNLNDYVRLTPQSSQYGEGITFAGINNRYNAIYIDGAVNNDVFGLAGSGTNGGQTGISPFSVDIIDQLQVVLSPYDVTLGGFAGAGINAVTKSGTNTIKGTAYTYLQNQSLVAKTNGTLADRLGIEREKVDDFSKRVYGFSLGGPIMKDKLFFFGNVEIQKDETPLPFETETYTSVAGRYSVSDLNRLRNHLINTYGYDPGTFGNVSDDLDGLKIFGKLNYNISRNHYLTLRHQYTKAEQFDRTAGSSSTINFSNNGIYFPSITNSTALELNSHFGSKYSNNAILSFVAVRDDRDPLAGDFPYVFIEDVSSGLIRFGSEEFSTANQLNQNIFAFTNNFNWYRGKHTLTFGTHNEFYDIYNVFIGQNYGTYRFASIDDFINGAPAEEYDRAYSLVDNLTGDGTAAAADFKAMQLGFYAQDEWTMSPKLRLTGGLRVDIPVITSDPVEDTYLNNTALPLMAAKYPIAKDAVAGKAPDGQIMLSPRLGFNYDVNGDNRTIVRGGAGLFTSRIPFVWPGAMFNNNGLTQGRVSEGDIAGDVDFIPNIQNQYTNPNFSVPSGQIDLFTKDFKFPQIFRSNLGVDFQMPFGIYSTVEALYTKTVNNINYTNINSDPTVDYTWTGSPDNREVFTRSSIDPTYSAVYLASNTSKGYGYNLTVSLAKNFDFGLNSTLAYSYGDAKALSEGTSSQNSSQWRGQVNINGRNDPSYGRTDFAVGHRFLSSLSYKHNWTSDKNMATTVSLFFNGQSGSPFSYVIGGSNARNLNNETGSTSRNRSLIYIPESASDINLVDYVSGSETITAAQQWEQLNAFIEEDAYLKNNRGSYAEKNGAWAPFSATFDLGIRQDVGINAGGQVHRIQFLVDIFNIANLLNSKWGTVYTVPGDFNNYFLYQFEGYEADGTTPRFTYRKENVGKDDYDIAGLASRWRMSFGMRYFFN
ncbi:MAG: TonB-dependent receptor [Calditrichaeota bacterium]|nr:TonB-dependent receptor [Calditrichota bacterium]